MRPRKEIGAGKDILKNVGIIMIDNFIEANLKSRGKEQRVNRIGRVYRWAAKDSKRQEVWWLRVKAHLRWRETADNKKGNSALLWGDNSVDIMNNNIYDDEDDNKNDNIRNVDDNDERTPTLTTTTRIMTTTWGHQQLQHRQRLRRRQRRQKRQKQQKPSAT